jgi:hypothetical protein
MIIGESIEYVVDWFGGNDSALASEDAIIFLAHHGVYLATYGSTEGGLPRELSPSDEVILRIPLRNRPALLTVSSERFPGGLHSVYWDGQYIRDPNPDVPDKRNLEDYDIVEYWPLIFTEARWKAIKEKYR